MNFLRKIMQDVLKYNFRRRYLLKRTYPIRALCSYFPWCHKHGLKIVTASSLIPQGKINVEDDLRKAIEEGEDAILNLMKQLEDLIITASKEYRLCLTHQIELINKAINIGQEAWDELPKFRTLAHELNSELNAYLVLLRTIGEMAYDQTLLISVLGKDSIKHVLDKYNELDEILKGEFEQNKIMEQKLLEVNIANILSGINSK